MFSKPSQKLLSTDPNPALYSAQDRFQLIVGSSKRRCMTIQPKTDMTVTLSGWVGIVTFTAEYSATKSAKQVVEDCVRSAYIKDDTMNVTTSCLAMATVSFGQIRSCCVRSKRL